MKRKKLIWLCAAGIICLVALLTASASFADDGVACESCGGNRVEMLAGGQPRPTCTEDQYDHYRCVDCMHEFRYVLREALGHDIQSTNVCVKAATCTEQALYKSECARCAERGPDEARGDLLPHDMQVVAELRNATCTSPGISRTVCSMCSMQGEIEGPAATGHQNKVPIPEQASTCTADGWKAHLKCSSCGQRFSLDDASREMAEADVRIPPHDLIEVPDSAATCRDAGVRHHWKCTACGRCFAAEDRQQALSDADVSIPRTQDHQWDAAPEVHAPTCAEAGYTCKICSVCGALGERTSIPATGAHSLRKTSDEKAPSCTRAGHAALYTCADCGGVFTDEAGAAPATEENRTLAALGHTAGEKIGRADSTCTKDGREAHYVCGRCGALLSEDTKEEVTEADLRIPAGHALELRAAAHKSCEADGAKAHYECTKCGKLFSAVDQSREISSRDIRIPAHELEEVAAKPATCKDTGTAAHYRCTLCGKRFADEDRARVLSDEDVTTPVTTDHKWEDEVHAPSCATGGYTIPVCSVCGARGEKIASTDPTGKHLLRKTADGKEPTCAGEGLTALYTCADCGAEFTDDKGTTPATGNNRILPPAGHSGMTKTEGREATCTEDGIREHWTCGVCRERFADESGTEEVPSPVLPATGHGTLEHISGKDHTCTEDGSIEYWRCPKCKAIFTDDGAKNETTFDDTIDKAPGQHDFAHHPAQDKGVHKDGNLEYWECRRCGLLYTDPDGQHPAKLQDLILPSDGHTTKRVEEKKVTCTEDGKKAHYVCVGCEHLYLDEAATKPVSETELVLPAAGHREKETAVSADCETPGNVTYECTVCGAVREGGHTDALGHRLENVPEKAPTQTESGRKAHFVCLRCGKLFWDDGASRLVESEADLEIPRIGHTHSYEDKTILPTCTEGGYTEHTCTGCAHSFRDSETDPTGHSLELVEQVEPTETEDGIHRHWKCTDCGRLFDDENQEIPDPDDVILPATGHVHVYCEKVVAPTCTEGGYTEYRCVRAGCGDTYREDEKDPIGHKLAKVPEVPAAADQNGMRGHWKCENCGALFTDELAKHETDAKDLVLPATGHTFSDTVVKPDCVTPGRTDHVCTDHPDCDRSYSDTETPALGHDLTYYPAIDPAITHEGNVEYWKCGRCGKYFLDADCTKQTDAAGVVIAAIITPAPTDPATQASVPAESAQTPNKDPGGSVQTGDREDLAGYFCMAAIAAAVLVVFMVLYLRSRKKDSHSQRVR